MIVHYSYKHRQDSAPLVFLFVMRPNVLDTSFQSHRMKTHLLATFRIVMV